MSKTYLIFVYGGALGHVTRQLSLTSTLIENNHNVIVYGSGKYFYKFNEHGIESYKIDSPSQKDIFKNINQGKVYHFYIEQLENDIQKDIQILKKHTPDVIIGDFRPSLKISSKIRDIPYITFTNVVNTRFCNYNLPPFSKLHKLFGQKLGKLILPIANYILNKKSVNNYNKLAKKHKTNLINSIQEIWEGELTFLADLPSVFSIKENHSVKYCGPMLFNYNERNTKLPEKFIYISMGSTGWNELPTEILENNHIIDYELIVSTADFLNIDDHIGTKKIRYVNYLSEEDISKASLIICHGGSGTIYQALKYQIPIIGIPKTFEQYHILSQLHTLGLASIIDRRKPLNNEFSKAFQFVLNNVRNTDTTNLKKEFTTFNGSFYAYKVITDFVSRQKRF